MPDNLSPEDRRKTMRSIKSAHTRPERRLRALLSAMKYSGWRLNPQDIPGKPDIAFIDKKVAIFVDGCFWHGCPICNRPIPVTNRAYWEIKIQGNIDRDKNYDKHLRGIGWKVIRIWEHEIKKGDPWKKFVKRLLKDLER